MEFFASLTPRRRFVFLIAVLWFAAASYLLLPFVLFGSPLPWEPVYVLFFVILNSFSGAAVLAEVLRGLVPYFARMKVERHFFWFWGFFAVFLGLTLSGYLLMVRSIESKAF